MANTSKLTQVKQFVAAEMSKQLNTQLKPKSVTIGVSSGGQIRAKEFDGVSGDGKIIISVANNSGYTSGGKKPTGKIRSVFATCYFLLLTKAEKKILILTDKEFYDIFEKESDGLLCGIELLYFALPPELEDIKSNITQQASLEMS